MPTEQAIAHLDEYGYVVLEGALTPNQTDELRQRSAELIANERAAGAELYLDGKAQRCGTW